MRISVRTDLKKATKRLNNIQRNQIPFAASKALSETAEFAAVNLNDDTNKYLDRPTPFTRRAFTFKRATKRKLSAIVSARPAQDEYLRFQVFGGARVASGRALVLPVEVRRNRFGNIPRNEISRLLARPDTFSGTFRGVAGIWQRGHISKKGKFSTAGKSRATNLRLLVAYESKAKYKKRFPFFSLVDRYTKKAFAPIFEKTLRQALRTAR